VAQAGLASGDIYVAEWGEAYVAETWRCHVRRAPPAVPCPCPCPQETTLAHHLYGGYLRNSVVCGQCGAVSATYESTVSLPVDVAPGVDSLDAALRRLTEVERLEGENKYRCDA
jgi:hypothetical protein